MKGFVRMIADDDLEPREGGLYESSIDGKLRVGIGGAWIVCKDDRDAVRKFARHHKLKKKDWRYG